MSVVLVERRSRFLTGLSDRFGMTNSWGVLAVSYWQLTTGS
jgi:hypothetical protein